MDPATHATKAIITASGILVQRAVSNADIDACLRLRHAVFTVEQGIDAALDDDGQDSSAFHYLAVDQDDRPVGTVRAVVHDGIAKIGRVAVLKKHREKGIGTSLMRFALTDQAELGAKEAIVGSQVTAIGFYEKLGFVSDAKEFLDAGIPHVTMRLSLSQGPSL